MYDCHKKRKAISLPQIEKETISSRQYTESEDVQTARFILYLLPLLTIKQNEHREEGVAVDIKCIQPS